MFLGNGQGICLVKTQAGAVNQKIGFGEGFSNRFWIPVELSDRKSAGDQRGKLSEKFLRPPRVPVGQG